MNLYLKQTRYMEHAIKMAKKGGILQEVPVGAVVVERNSGLIIAKAHNKVESKKSPLYHAEIIALTLASKKLGSKYLSECDLYITLEPCPMCAAAISMYRIGRLYYGAKDSKFGAVESVSNFFNSKNCFHRPEIYSGIYEETNSLLMKDFFRYIRNR